MLKSQFIVDEVPKIEKKPCWMCVEMYPNYCLDSVLYITDIFLNDSWNLGKLNILHIYIYIGSGFGASTFTFTKTYKTLFTLVGFHFHTDFHRAESSHHLCPLPRSPPGSLPYISPCSLARRPALSNSWRGFIRYNVLPPRLSQGYFGVGRASWPYWRAQTVLPALSLCPTCYPRSGVWWPHMVA